MFIRLFLLFTIIPFVEMVILLQLGDLLGVLPTLLIVIITGALGAYFVKREGFRVWKKIQAELQVGNLPGDQLVDALLLFVAGIVLITPGILTDIIGFALLIPHVRSIIKAYLKTKFKVTLPQNGYQRAEPTTFETLD